MFESFPRTFLREECRMKCLENTPEGYTWHHVEDGKTMMLVPSDIHSAVRHTGGASLIKKGLRL